MFENLKFRIRYGKILDFKSLTHEQKELLLDPRIKNHVDGLGKKTVQLVPNTIEGVGLSLVDTYCYDCYDNKKNKPDYTIERSWVYKKIFDRFPEYIGSFENRYRLSDGSLVSITFEVDDLTKKLNF